MIFNLEFPFHSLLPSMNPIFSSSKLAKQIKRSVKIGDRAIPGIDNAMRCDGMHNRVLRNSFPSEWTLNFLAGREGLICLGVDQTMQCWLSSNWTVFLAIVVVRLSPFCCAPS